MVYKDKKAIWGIVTSSILLLMVYAIALLNPAMFGASTNQSQSSFESGVINEIPESIGVDIAQAQETPSLQKDIPSAVLDAEIDRSSSISGSVISSDFQASDTVREEFAALVEEQLVATPPETSNIRDFEKTQAIDVEKINTELETLEQEDNRFDIPEELSPEEFLGGMPINEQVEIKENSFKNDKNLKTALTRLKEKDSKNLTFKFGELTLSDKAIALVRSIANVMNSHNEIHMAIDNYTDSFGDDNYNLKLSKQRAKVIYNAFLTEGVDKEQLSYQGLGEVNPIVSNSTLSGRRKNRRTELTFSLVN